MRQYSWLSRHQDTNSTQPDPQQAHTFLWTLKLSYSAKFENLTRTNGTGKTSGVCKEIIFWWVAGGTANHHTQHRRATVRTRIDGQYRRASGRGDSHSWAEWRVCGQNVVAGCQLKPQLWASVVAPEITERIECVGLTSAGHKELLKAHKLELGCNTLTEREREEGEKKK